MSLAEFHDQEPAAGRHSADAGRRLHVCAQRRHGQVAGRQLLGRPGGADPLDRRLPRARSDDRQAGRRRSCSAWSGPDLQILRVVATTLDTALFYAAVVYLPLADVMSFYMAGPIYVAALSHLLLGEKVGWRRWMAILVGFCGVLIMLKPSSAAFSLSSLFALVGSISFAFAIILNRRLRGTSDTTLVTWQTIGTLLVGGVLTIGDWQTPSAARSRRHAAAGHRLLHRPSDDHAGAEAGAGLDAGAAALHAAAVGGRVRPGILRRCARPAHPDRLRASSCSPACSSSTARTRSPW